MTKDILVLAIGALFGLGVALVSLAIPTYLPKLPDWVAFWMFWGGLSLMSIMVINVALLYFWWEQQGSKVGPTLLINLGLCLIIAGLVWNYTGQGDLNSKFSGLYVYALTGMGTLQAGLQNKGAERLHNVRIDIMPQTKDKPVKGLASRFFPFLDPIAFPLNTELESASYYIEFRTDEGTSVEQLIVSLENNVFHQEITVLKRGKTIFYRKE
jgi:hypothetical protein